MVCVGEWVVCVGNSDQYVILFSKSPENVSKNIHSPQATGPVHHNTQILFTSHPHTPSHWFFMLDYIAIDSRSTVYI